MERLQYVLDNDEGMEGVQAAGLVLVGIIIIAVLVLFGNRIKQFFTKSTNNVNQMIDALPSNAVK